MRGATLDISEARKQFNTLDKRLDAEPYVYITRHGKQAFAVVNVDYLRTVTETIEIMSDREAHAALLKSIEDIQHGRLHDHDDVEDELG